MKSKKLSIIIPVYNEKNFIFELLQKVNSVDLGDIKKEIIVIDDYSTDGTREILSKKCNKLIDKLLFNDHNLGKGATLKKGFSHASGDIIIIQDADLEYDPSDYGKLVMPIFNNEADVVYGSRFLNKNQFNGYKQNQFANKLLTRLSNLFTGFKITDMETCYKAFKTSIIKSISIKENRFGFEPEITAKLSKLNIKLIEVPISYYPRTKSEGKKINIKDGFRALYCIIKYGL